MKIFQIVDGFLYREYKEFSNLEELKERFPESVKFIEAPDYVFESWGYDETQEGDNRFIKPTPPDGFLYDDNNGTFYPKELESNLKRQKYENLVHQEIREKYTETDEFKIIREYLANPDNMEMQTAFAEYNQFVVSCKKDARTKVYGDK